MWDFIYYWGQNITFGLGSNILKYYKKNSEGDKEDATPLYFGRFCMCMSIVRFLFDFRVSRTLFLVYYFFEYFFLKHLITNDITSKKLFTNFQERQSG